MMTKNQNFALDILPCYLSFVYIHIWIERRCSWFWLAKTIYAYVGSCLLVGQWSYLENDSIAALEERNMQTYLCQHKIYRQIFLMPVGLSRVCIKIQWGFQLISPAIISLVSYASSWCFSQQIPWIKKCFISMFLLNKSSICIQKENLQDVK